MPVANLWREKFNPDDDFVVMRLVNGLPMGTPLVKDDFSVRRLQQMYGNRQILPTRIYNEFIGVSSPRADDSGRVVDSAPVSAPASLPDPLDHDKSDLDELRALVDAAGVAVDKRWGEKRLNEELEKATAPSLPGVTDGTT